MVSAGWRALPYFTAPVRQFLNATFPKRWTKRSNRVATTVAGFYPTKLFVFTRLFKKPEHIKRKNASGGFENDSGDIVNQVSNFLFKVISK